MPLLIGTAVATTSLAFLAFAHSSPWEIYVATALLGVGIGLSFASMANLIVELAFVMGSLGVTFAFLCALLIPARRRSRTAGTRRLAGRGDHQGDGLRVGRPLATDE